jgi:ATP-independent RNA helicase DbpA
MKDAENNHKSDNNQLFCSLPLSEALLKNLTSLNYEAMTPIQVHSLPIMLEKNDVIAKASTGTGKTIAFSLTMLNHLQLDLYAVQGLVLCPTRELADQVCQEVRRLARLIPNIKVLNLSGGLPMKTQLDSLRHGAHIIVGTPGRILKHITKSTLKLDKLQTLVLDEADRMLDMGFFDDIKAIKKRQTLLFSATYSDEVKKLSRQFMQKPQEVFIETQLSKFEIDQRFYEVQNSNNKFPLLKSLLIHYKPSSALIFCNTKQKTVEVVEQLKKTGFSATELNGDMEQAERDLAIIRFANQSCSILVATDVAARGLDIKELPAVINYDLAFEKEIHVHRVGRTGRAGNKGLALTLVTTADAERFEAIEQDMAQPVVWGNQDKLSSYIENKIPQPDMVTICISAGKKDKIRPGDILGVLTKEAGLPGDSIGKIDIGSIFAYVAIHRNHVNKAYQYLNNGKLKGRKLSVKKY